MLSISRWMAAAILVTVFTVSALAIPSFLPDRTFHSLPRWAQNRIVPGIEYQGGSSLLLEVDHAAVRQDMVDQLRSDVRKILRENRVVLVSPPIVRGANVEVRISASDWQRGLTVLQEQLVLPYQSKTGAARVMPVHVPFGTTSVSSQTGHRSASSLPPDVTIESVGDGLVRLTVTETALREKIQQRLRATIYFSRRRTQELGDVVASIEPRGPDRIEIVAPGVDLTTRAIEH